MYFLNLGVKGLSRLKHWPDHICCGTLCESSFHPLVFVLGTLGGSELDLAVL